MQIEPWIEQRFIERIDGFGVLLGDMAVAHVLSDNTGILALGQCVVVAVAGAGFGLLNAQLLQQRGDLFVDVLGAPEFNSKSQKTAFSDSRSQQNQQLISVFPKTLV
ncbi:MAG: hypothetical protein ORN28_04165, partial [Rhodoferax sp.]|nr:hypothetical protein [Rhodoferax sp.]